MVSTNVTGTRVSRTKGVPLLTYVEDGFHSIPWIRPNDEEYGRILQGKILANVDIVLVNPINQTFYLARRRARPMSGWWWMGGNTGDINLPLPNVLYKVLERELGFGILIERMTFRLVGEYFWKDRAQQPHNIGCHMCGLTFSVEVTAEEVSRIKLDPQEYEGGLIEFTRADLVREGVYPTIIDAYNIVFPPEVLHHDVLISFKEGTSEQDRTRILELYQTLAKDCGGQAAGIIDFRAKRISI